MAIGPTSITGLLGPGNTNGGSGTDNTTDQTDETGSTGETGGTGGSGSTGTTGGSGTTSGTTETGTTDPISAPQGTTGTDTTGSSRSNGANIIAPSRADAAAVLNATALQQTDAETEIANARASAEAYQAEARQQAILDTISAPVEAAALEALGGDTDAEQGDPFAAGNGPDLTASGRDG